MFNLHMKKVNNLVPVTIDKPGLRIRFLLMAVRNR